VAGAAAQGGLNKRAQSQARSNPLFDRGRDECPAFFRFGETARPRQALDQAVADRIGRIHEHDRYAAALRNLGRLRRQVYGRDGS
jgi:hypothetical protein